MAGALSSWAAIVGERQTVFVFVIMSVREERLVMLRIGAGALRSAAMFGEPSHRCRVKGVMARISPSHAIVIPRDTPAPATAGASFFRAAAAL